MTDVIVYETKRYRCPHCRRSYAHEKAARAHEARCFNNPQRQGCRTCRHAEGPDGMTFTSTGFVADCAIDQMIPHCCPACGAEVLPEPGYCPNMCSATPISRMRVLCPSWEARDG